MRNFYFDLLKEEIRLHYLPETSIKVDDKIIFSTKSVCRQKKLIKNQKIQKIF